MRKQQLYILGIVVLLLCSAGERAGAQDFGMEQNTNGSYTFTWPNGTSITTSANGSYSASNSTGSCSGCVQMLPEVVVYGYRNTSTNTYSYTSYNYEGTYYNLPPDPSNPPPGYTYNAPPSTVITTAPSPVVTAPPVSNPCGGVTQLQSNAQSSPFNINNTAYTSTVNSLLSTLGSDVNEKSSLFGVNKTAGQLMTTPIATGGSGSTGGVSIPADMVPFGAMHTHTNDLYPAPSAGDIYALAQANAAHSSYTTSYVLAADGSRYALVVTDASKAAAFLTNYPSATTVSGSSWIQNSNATGIYHDWSNVYNNYNPGNGAGVADITAFENAQAYILKAYDTGIVLLKSDAAGNYTEQHIVRTTDANGNVKYSSYKCN